MLASLVSLAHVPFMVLLWPAEEAGGQVTILGRSEEDEDMQGLDLSHLTTGAALAELDTAATQQAAAAGPSQQPGAGGGDEELPDAAAEAGAPADGDAQQLAAAAEPAEPSSMLPPDILEPPPGECPPATQKKVANWVAVSRARGLSLNGELRKSRPYRNPEFFSKMVQHEGIFEYGSCFAPEVGGWLSALHLFLHCKRSSHTGKDAHASGGGRLSGVSTRWQMPFGQSATHLCSPSWYTQSMPTVQPSQGAAPCPLTTLVAHLTSGRAYCSSLPSLAGLAGN